MLKTKDVGHLEIRSKLNHLFLGKQSYCTVCQRRQRNNDKESSECSSKKKGLHKGRGLKVFSLRNPSSIDSQPFTNSLHHLKTWALHKTPSHRLKPSKNLRCTMPKTKTKLHTRSFLKLVFSCFQNEIKKTSSAKKILRIGLFCSVWWFTSCKRLRCSMP